MNNRQDEQGDRGGTARQPVDRADNERAKGLVKSQAAETLIEFRGGDGALEMTMFAPFVPMGVAVNIIAMHVRVLMHRAVFPPIFRDDFDGAEIRAQIQAPEQDQHQGDAEFQAQPETRRHDDAEKNDRAPNDQEGQAMPDPPENSGPGRARDAALPAHDRGHGDDMIRIGRVSHAEEKAEEQNGQ